MSQSTPYAPLRGGEFARDGNRLKLYRNDHVAVEEASLVDLTIHEKVSEGFKTRAKRRFSSVVWWWPEIVTSLLSVASLLAMVLVLRMYNNRPIDNLGLPHALTLNGLLAVIATLNRAFMLASLSSGVAQELWLYYATRESNTTCRSQLQDMDTFDAAARGAWGSLLFLIRFRGRRFIACLGALITILALSFDTFAQQLVAYDAAIPVPHGSPLSPGNLPRMEQLNESPSGCTIGDPNCQTPLSMVAAIHNGILVTDASPLVPDCPTGNCTWPLTPSLAVCGGCVKTEYSLMGCDDYKYTEYGKEVVDQAFNCSYRVPSGNNFSILNFPKYSGANSSYTWDPNAHSTGFWSLPIGSGMLSPTGSGAHYNRSNTSFLAVWDNFGVPVDYNSTGQQFTKNYTYHSSECALWMCVQIYEPSTSNGRYKRTVNASINYADTIDVYETLFNKTLPTYADPNNVTQFIIGNWATGALSMALKSATEGSVSFEGGVASYSSDLIQGIWNGTSELDAWIKGLAISLTNYIQPLNITSRDEYNGTAYQLGVRVRWGWIALPAALVGLSILFLGAVIVRTAYSPVYPWKASPLAFLLFDLDDEARRAAMGEADKFRGIHRTIGKKKARLMKHQNQAWKFEVRKA